MDRATAPGTVDVWSIREPADLGLGFGGEHRPTPCLSPASRIVPIPCPSKPARRARGAQASPPTVFFRYCSRCSKLTGDSSRNAWAVNSINIGSTVQSASTASGLDFPRPERSINRTDGMNLLSVPAHRNRHGEALSGRECRGDRVVQREARNLATSGTMSQAVRSRSPGSPNSSPRLSSRTSHKACISR